MNAITLKIEKEIQSGFFSWLVDFYNIIRQCWFLVIMLLIGVVALWIAPPGIDVMKSVGVGYTYPFWTGLLLFLFLYWWGNINWYGSRIILNFSDIPFSRQEQSFRIQKYVPRVLGLFPYIIFLVALFNANNPNYLYYFITILLGVTFLVFTILRRKLFEKVKSKSKGLKNIKTVPPLRQESYDLNFKELSKQWLPIMIMAGLFLLLFIIILLAPYAMPLILTPLGVILSALAGWTSLGVAVIFFDKLTYLPLMGFFVILTIIWGALNLNFNATIKNKKFETVERPTFSSYFKNWAAARMQEDAKISPGSRYPVFIVTAEGGASRSGYWVGRTLSQLQEHTQNFGEHIFAISSVSGGSLGSGIFTCLYDHYFVSGNHHDTISFPNRIKDFLGKDYLSHVTAGMVYPDLFQKFLPFGISSWSRAKYLEGAWEEPWQQIDTSFNYFSRDFNKLWEADSSRIPYKTPLMVLNTTHVESGKRAVISYPKFEPEKHTDVIDLQSNQVISSQFKMSEAVSSSARFPYITPSSRLLDTANHVWGHLVDGGYYENSGLYTALDIYNQIKDDTLVSKKYFQVQFLVILAFPEPDQYPASVSSNEILDPFRTILNTRSARNSHSKELLDMMLEEEGIYVDTLSEFKNRSSRIILTKGKDVPVNWYLSTAALDTIETNIQAQMQGEEYKRIINLLAPWDNNLNASNTIIPKQQANP